jgi:membrane AbrB-like protein
MMRNLVPALSVVVSVIICHFLLGWFMTVRRMLPGTTGIWGSSPGAATPMTLMSAAYGADMRLVALMQYLRVVLVSLAATVVAGYMTEGASAARPPLLESLFPPVVWSDMLLTAALSLAGAYLGHLTRIPAGPILMPILVAALAHNSGIMRLELPGWELAVTFAFIGWCIGLRFNRAVFLYALRLMPKITAAILIMIVSCGGLAAILVISTGIDPLTAYLATSPGGLDAVAIIAATSGADIPFVMAIQTVRLIMVLITGPILARFATRRLDRMMTPRN